MAPIASIVRPTMIQPSMTSAGDVLEARQALQDTRVHLEAVGQRSVAQVEGARERRVLEATEQAVQFLLDAVGPGPVFFEGAHGRGAHIDLGDQFLGVLDECHRLHGVTLFSITRDLRCGRSLTTD